MIHVALDAMGGDLAPASNVSGALLALQENQEIKITLIGRENDIRDCLANQEYDAERLEILHAEEVIETGEPPVFAIQSKKESSLVKGLRMIRSGEADAFISAGSTGAILVGGQTIAGRLKGVKRAALAVVIPTIKGKSVLIDCGANVDAKPENLIQFSVMGSLYSRYILNNEDPKVGLINIGTEEEKGNQLTRETYPLLSELESIHFVGNAEARDVPFGVSDVLVCEAFTGNVVLKMYEGVAKALIGEIKSGLKTSVRGMIGGAIIKSPLKKMLKKYDNSEDGGAPLLGLKGLVMKAHGNSSALQIKNAVLQSVDFAKQDLSTKIEKAIAELK